MSALRTLAVASLATFMVAGCSTQEASRTFQTSTMLCTEQGATLKIDGEQLSKVIDAGGGLVRNLSTYPLLKDWKPEAGKDHVSLDDLKALLAECREFLSR